MKTAIYLIASFIIVGSVSAETTTDPLQHFKSQWDLEGVTKIYKLQIDINDDGLEEIFLSTGKSDPPDDVFLSWQLYFAKNGGQYEVAAEKKNSGLDTTSIPGFRKDQYWVGLIPELNRYGLLYLSCGSGGQAKCQLKAIVLEDGGWKELPIGQPVDAEANYEQLAQRFASPSTPAVQELNL